MKVLSVFGTRPEAIKMAPLMQALSLEPTIQNRICVTGQHRQMLDPVMALFKLRADHDLNVMVPGQGLNGLYTRVMNGVDRVIEEDRPDIVLVHGDTSTANASAVAAFHQRVKVGHVEAGLRTYDLKQPFPEEMNRRVIDTIGHWLFAPTQTSKQNLMQENLGGRILVTGNTVIDALDLTCRTLEIDPVLKAALSNRYPWVDDTRRLVLVTGHRRENFGDGFEQICEALELLSRRTDIQIVYPVHMNPEVRSVVERTLSHLENIHLIAPLAYPDFVWFMCRAHIILTDSGGVQEEAPSLGKPVLVMRNVTERPEAVEAGTVTLVGTDPIRIVKEVAALLDHAEHYAAASGKLNPYGDGRAAERIVAALCERDFSEFNPVPAFSRLAAAA